MVFWFIHWLPGVTAGDAHADAIAWLVAPAARAALAAALCLGLTLMAGPRLIVWLGNRFREPDKCPSPAIRMLHQAKQHTPTMGGAFLVAGLCAAVLLLADPRNPLVMLAIGVTVALAALGAVDDLVKLRTTARGVEPRVKLLVQVVIAVVASMVLYRCLASSTEFVALRLPGLRTVHVGGWYVPLATLVIVASTNAVNLTDGLDGLAGGCLLFAVTALAVLLCAQGEGSAEAPILVRQTPGELLVVAGAMSGCVLGFLWFNRHPARVFMGNTGSLALGGLLALLALAARQELLLVLIGGVFVVEASSVLVQIAAHKWTGRRVLRCAPLHHHFELAGWTERTIVVRFWIVAGLCAAVGVAVGLLG